MKAKTRLSSLTAKIWRTRSRVPALTLLVCAALATLMFAASPPLAAPSASAQSPYSATIIKTSQYSAPLCPGTSINYVITFTTTSSPTTPPVNATIHDPLPAGVTYVAGSAIGGATYNAGLNRIEWQGVLLPTGPNNHVTIGFGVTMNAGVATGTAIDNTATGTLSSTPAVVVQSSASDTVFCGMATYTPTATPTRTATPTVTRTPTPTRTPTRMRTTTELALAGNDQVRKHLHE